MINQAVIVAGGKGERLKLISGDLPKPLVQINNKSIIDRLIYKLKRNNINNIFISTNYLSDIFTKKYKKDSTIEIIKDNNFSGNAGFYYEYKKRFKGNTLIIYGDLYFETSLNKYINYHFRNKFINSLMLHKVNHRKDSDLIMAKNKQIFDWGGYYVQY